MEGKFIVLAMRTEEIQDIGFMISTAMAPAGIYKDTSLLLTAALHLLLELKRLYESFMHWPFVPGFLEEAIKKGGCHELQEVARLLKADLEIYTGMFLPFIIWFQESSFFGLVLFL